jgi:hypothetical protein
MPKSPVKKPCDVEKRPVNRCTRGQINAIDGDLLLSISDREFEALVHDTKKQLQAPPHSSADKQVGAQHARLLSQSLSTWRQCPQHA